LGTLHPPSSKVLRTISVDILYLLLDICQTKTYTGKAFINLNVLVISW